MADPLHRAIFPGCVLSEDSTAAHRFNTLQGGGYFALGTGGPATGRGANVLVIDDPVKDSQEANSETARRRLARLVHFRREYAFSSSRCDCLNTNSLARRRLGWRVLANDVGNDWEVLSLPAIAEHDESFRREGEALWPERYGLAELAKKRTEVGERVWASQYQQRPAAAEGAIFKRAWWQFYRLPFDGPFISVVQSWDTAFKKGSENDYSVCTTWGVTDSGYYLLHLWRERVDFPELKRRFASLAEHWKPNAILVEDRASGQSLIQELKNSTRTSYHPGPKSDSDKQTRAQAITPIIGSRQDFFAGRSAPWMQDDFVDEMSSFPNGLHDDIVDSTTQALNYLRKPDILFTPAMARLMCGIREPAEELDKEELWRKAMRGYPMTPEEIKRM